MVATLVAVPPRLLHSCLWLGLSWRRLVERILSWSRFAGWEHSYSFYLTIRWRSACETERHRFADRENIRFICSSTSGGGASGWCAASLLFIAVRKTNVDSGLAQAPKASLQVVAGDSIVRS